MSKQLYRAKIIPLYAGHRQEDKSFADYTHAVSIGQAHHFLMGRYPYPQYIVETPVLDARQNIVRRTNPRLDNFVTHLGYESINAEQAGGMKSDIELIAESQERLSKVRIIPDEALTDQQRASLALARIIAKDVSSKKVRGIYAADIPPASDRVSTAGMYNRQEESIFISPTQLARGRTTVDTDVHELSHHTTGAEDGDKEHQMEISRLGGMVVTKTREGSYDSIVGNPAFVW
jgi:hypothetical protein